MAKMVDKLIELQDIFDDLRSGDVDIATGIEAVVSFYGAMSESLANRITVEIAEGRRPNPVTI